MESAVAVEQLKISLADPERLIQALDQALGRPDPPPSGSVEPELPGPILSSQRKVREHVDRGLPFMIADPAPRMQPVWIDDWRLTQIPIALAQGTISVCRERNRIVGGTQIVRAIADDVSVTGQDLPGLFYLWKGLQITRGDGVSGSIRTVRHRVLRSSRWFEVEMDGTLWMVLREHRRSSFRRDDGTVIFTTSGDGPRLLSSSYWRSEFNVEATLFECVLASVLWFSGIFTRTRRLWVPENFAVRLPLPAVQRTGGDRYMAGWSVTEVPMAFDRSSAPGFSGPVLTGQASARRRRASQWPEHATTGCTMRYAAGERRCPTRVAARC